MPGLEHASCIYHPGKIAASKCKQCGKTTCAQCTVSGPTGAFCSTPCRTANEARVIQAGDTSGRARSTFFVRIRGIFSKLIILLVILLAAAWVTTFMYIPGLSEVINTLRASLGI